MKLKFSEQVAMFERNPKYGWLCQREIAAAMPPGFSVRTWQDWVTGRREPPGWVQVLVLDYLERRLRK